MNNKVKNAGVLHSPDNLSDHSPVFCEIECNLSFNSETSVKSTYLPHHKWTCKMADPEDKECFREKLNNILLSVTVPESVLHCTDVHCKDDRHLYDADFSCPQF